VGFGDVDAEALSGGAFQVHGLGAEGDGADLGVVEGLAGRFAAGDFVAVPEFPAAV
jgi:hypothetical protein